MFVVRQVAFIIPECGCSLAFPSLSVRCHTHNPYTITTTLY